MMKKSKKGGDAKPIRTDLHALSPLPLEFIVTRLSLLSKRGMVVDIHEYDSDDCVFQITHPKMRSIATGSLRRWEGTHTRVDATTTLQTLPDCLEWIAHFVVIFFLFLGFSVSWILMGFALSLTFIGTAILATVLSLILPISRFFDRFRNQALIDADRQMQLLALILTNNLPDGTQPMMEFDGTDQSLELMLRQQRMVGE